MDPVLLYPVGVLESCRFAFEHLKRFGFAFTDHPSPEITHLLLDVPSFDGNGLLRDGSDLKELLRMLPKTITVIGGNLTASFLKGYRIMDLLEDTHYLAMNAAITAECALRAAAPHMSTTFADSPALILGWGRIGKCLAQLLTAIGCPVAVAARKETDLAMLNALGYEAVDFSRVTQVVHHFRILFNTVPDLSLHSPVPEFQEKGIAIDLASYPGMSGINVIAARGLPGKYAPETSGKLIAETVIRRSKEEAS